MAGNESWLTYVITRVELGGFCGQLPPSYATYDWKVSVGSPRLVLCQPAIGPVYVPGALERRIDLWWRWSVTHAVLSVFASYPQPRCLRSLRPCSYTFPHDVWSEVGFRDTHSAFSDPDMLTTSSFRVFTHHSDYAGDLILGPRSHQPQQHFDYGVRGPGLGLSGIQAPNPHSLQVPHLQGIDLHAITLQDSSLNLGYDTNTEGASSPHEGDSPDHVPGSGYVSPHLIIWTPPPATPIMSFRTARATTVSLETPLRKIGVFLSLPPNISRRYRTNVRLRTSRTLRGRLPVRRRGIR